MTSDLAGPREAFVWTWLPDRIDPGVAGRFAPTPQGLQFNYGRSYLARTDKVPLYLPELPLQSGVLPLPTGLAMPGCLRDAAPDAWGSRMEWLAAEILARARSSHMHTGDHGLDTLLARQGADLPEFLTRAW